MYVCMYVCMYACMYIKYDEYTYICSLSSWIFLDLSYWAFICIYIFLFKTTEHVRTFYIFGLCKKSFS